MARADLLVELVRAGSNGDQALFRKTLEALIAEERSKQHNVLADRLQTYLFNSQSSNGRVNSNGFFNKHQQLSSNLVAEMLPQRRLSDLILTDTVLSASRQVIEEQNRGDLLRAHNLEPRNRLLFVGPPGNGKTTLAEAFATELALPFIMVRYESLIGSYLGETATRVAQLFDYVRTRQCVLFFDEFDVVGKERGDVHETGEIKRVVSSLLLQVDALPSYVLIITATNHPELLDRAVWRRFQVRLQLDPPTRSQATEWFQNFQSHFDEPLGYTSGTLAKYMSGLSFSELEQFCLDIKRQHILRAAANSLQDVVKQCLKQWNNQYSLPQNPVP